jgi:hypothetical protein
VAAYRLRCARTAPVSGEAPQQNSDASVSKKNYFFLSGRCVSADAAADLAAFEDFGSLSTFAAADAALALVTSEFLRRVIMIPPLVDKAMGKQGMFPVSPCIFALSAVRH